MLINLAIGLILSMVLGGRTYNMYITETEVRSYLIGAGFEGVHLNQAVNIAMCESSFNTNAHNTTGEDSRGLMQINVQAHPEYLPIDLFDPALNTRVAYEIYQAAGNTFRDWTCARTLGYYKRPGDVLPILGVAFLFGIVLYFI